MNDFKSTIVTILNSGSGLNMDADLTCYPTHDGFYFVEYFYSEETMPFLDLTDHERTLIMKEEELIEIFDDPEEAADFYLRLSRGNIKALCSYPATKPCKRTLEEKVLSFDKDKYF